MAGHFFALEGIDGSGKSTQIPLLLARLEKEYGKSYGTREPTEGPIGSLLRQMLTGRVVADYRVIAQLFAADRLDHLTNGVDGLLPKIATGVTVVTDRYYFSSYAYHSEDMPMEAVIAANQQAAALLRPTATIYIDVPVELALERIQAGRFHQQLFETKSRLEKTKANYEKAFARLAEEERVLRIDGSQTAESVAEEIWQGVRGLLATESAVR